jgi:hypothetical protein
VRQRRPDQLRHGHAGDEILAEVSVQHAPNEVGDLPVDRIVQAHLLPDGG